MEGSYSSLRVCVCVWLLETILQSSSEISPKYLQSKDKMYRMLSVCQLNRQLLKQVSSHLSYRALEILKYFLSSYNSPAKKDVGDFTKGNILITYVTINK